MIFDYFAIKCAAVTCKHASVFCLYENNQIKVSTNTFNFNCKTRSWTTEERCSVSLWRNFSHFFVVKGQEKKKRGKQRRETASVGERYFSAEKHTMNGNK